MNIKFFLVICLIIGNTKNMIAQSPDLSLLLTFQHSQSPAQISNELNSSGGWITNSDEFSNVNVDYLWYKANAGEQFEPHTKDQLKYVKIKSYDAAISYITLSEESFASIKSAIQSTMTLDQMLIDDPKAKMYKFSNSNVVVEVLEPLIPLKYDFIRYCIIIYTKKDYESGLKLR